MDFLIRAAPFLAALLAIVASVGQLTETARLRRKMEVWRTAAEATPSHYDAKVLWSMHRAGMARLVAIDAVPFRWTFVAWASLAFFGYGVLDLGRTMGALPVDERNWYGVQEAGFDPALFTLPVLAALYVDYIIERSLARREIEHAYINRETLLKPPIMAERLVIPTPRALQSVSLIRRAALSLSACLGGYLLLWGMGVVVGLGPDETPSGWILLTMLTAAALIMLALFGGIIDAATDGRTRWEHPHRG